KEEPVERKEEPLDTTETIPNDNKNSGLDFVGEQMDFMEGDMPYDDVGNRMEDMADLDIDNSLNEEPANNESVDDSIVRFKTS
ncbi:hypothetical protein PENTCL1PPCAC_19150, partial [Pristionchus entomophagus]